MASPPGNKPGEGTAEGKPNDEKAPERMPSEKVPKKKPSERIPDRKSGGGSPGRRSSQELKERQPGERPHFRICYLCKREFGSQRLLSFFTLQLAC